MIDRRADWVRKNPERAKEAVRRWKAANKAKVSEYNRQWREKNPGAQRQWREQNWGDGKSREWEARWRKANRAKLNAYSMGRYAAKTKQTPSWLTREQRQEIVAWYEASALLTRITGIKHQVDHIVPLRGATVSGLHVPWNLQVLRAADNLKKSNRVQSEGHPDQRNLAPSL